MPSQKNRLRLRSWLKRQIDNGEFKGLEWLDREKQVFRVPWKHASRHSWQPEDVSLFRGWAIYTGKYKQGSKPDPKRWKTNFRCALNALPDIEHIPAEDSTRGHDAYRVYVMRTKSCKKPKFTGCQGKRIRKVSVLEEISQPTPPPSSESELESEHDQEEIIQLVDDLMTKPVDNEPPLGNNTSCDDLLPFGMAFFPLPYQSLTADWYCQYETDKVRVERSAA